MTAEELIEKLLELPPDAEVAITTDMTYKDIKNVEPVRDNKGQILFYVLV